MLGEIFVAVSGVDGVLAWAPASRANLAVLVVELEGLDESQNLIRVTAHRRLVHGDMTEVPSWSNDVQGTEGEASIKEQGTVASKLGVGRSRGLPLRKGLVYVSNEGNVNVAQTSLLLRSLNPGVVGEERINGNSNNLSANLSELFSLLCKK